MAMYKEKNEETRAYEHGISRARRSRQRDWRSQELL